MCGWGNCFIGFSNSFIFLPEASYTLVNREGMFMCRKMAPTCVIWRSVNSRKWVHIPTVQEKNPKFWVLGSWERGLLLFRFLISKIKRQLLQYAPSEILLLSVIFSTRREIKWNPGLFQTVLNFLLLISAIRLRLTQLGGSLEKMGSPVRAPRQLIPLPICCLVGKLNIATANVNIAITTASLLFDMTRFSEVCCLLNFTYANSILRVAQHPYSLCGITGLYRFLFKTVWNKPKLI